MTVSGTQGWPYEQADDRWADLDRFVALHKSLFGEMFEWAGQLRTTSMDLSGHAYAHVDVIAASLDARFASLSATGGFTGTSRDVFFDRLAFHIAELNAIAPFRVGNSHVLRIYCEQIARAAGFVLTLEALAESAWCKLLDESFVNVSHRAIAEALTFNLRTDDILCEARTGLCGLPLLPLRDPPAGRRYLTSLNKAKNILALNIKTARSEAAEKLCVSSQSGADVARISSARQELCYLRHPLGPEFQLEILIEAGSGKIEAVLHPNQSALEVVREISAAIAIAINMLPRDRIEQLVSELYQPPCSPGVSPHNERMAREFLNNSSSVNRADARFAALQREVDDVGVSESIAGGLETKLIAARAAEARLAIATRIRAGNLAPDWQGTASAVGGSSGDKKSQSRA